MPTFLAALLVSTTCQPSYGCQSHLAAPLVVTTFAVPVAVPVAPLAPVWYSYAPPAAVDDAVVERIAQRVAAALAKPAAANGPPASLISQRCARCHAGPNPKADFALDNGAALRGPERLKAVQSILNHQMPPASEPPLSAEDLRALLLELVKP